MGESQTTASNTGKNKGGRKPRATDNGHTETNIQTAIPELTTQHEYQILDRAVSQFLARGNRTIGSTSLLEFLNWAHQRGGGEQVRAMGAGQSPPGT